MSDLYHVVTDLCLSVFVIPGGIAEVPPRKEKNFEVEN